MKKISVIIPAYNKSKLTKKTINSVLNQTYVNLEIIVIDDGSTDNTKEIVNSIKDNRLIYVYQKNSGASNARNHGIKIAKGEYIAFLDCDDIFFENKIEKSISLLENNPTYDFLYTDVFLIDDKDKIIGKTPHFKNHPGSGWIARKLILCDYNITNSTLVAKKKCFEKIGGFDEKIFIPADREMLIRLAQNFKALYLSENLTGYRVIEETIYKNTDIALDEFIYMLNKYKKTDLILDNHFYKKCKSNIYYNFAKIYASNNEIKKTKKLLYHSITLNILNYKTFKKIIGLIILYIFPNIIYKYFKKYTRY